MVSGKEYKKKNIFSHIKRQRDKEMRYNTLTFIRFYMYELSRLFYSIGRKIYMHFQTIIIIFI